MIILELDYKFAESEEYVSFPFRQFSGFFQEQPQSSPAGVLMISEITAYVPVIDAEKSTKIDQLNRQPAIWRAKDPYRFCHEIGSDTEPAIFSAIKKIGPTPGVAYGWEVKITCSSLAGAKITSFSD